MESEQNDDNRDCHSIISYGGLEKIDMNRYDKE
jgi:hypothetical protein